MNKVAEGYEEGRGQDFHLAGIRSVSSPMVLLQRYLCLESCTLIKCSESCPYTFAPGMVALHVFWTTGEVAQGGQPSSMCGTIDEVAQGDYPLQQVPCYQAPFLIIVEHDI